MIKINYNYAILLQLPKITLLSMRHSALKTVNSIEFWNDNSS